MYSQFRWTPKALERNEILRLLEPLQPYILLEFLRALHCDTFLDVGANIGAYSLFVSKLDEVKKIYTFEAVPATYAELKANLVLNGLEQRVTAIHNAVSATRGTVRFGLVGECSGDNGVKDTAVLGAQEKYVNEIDVESVTLDEAIAERGQTLGLKIDVEGHEGKVLLGAKSVLTGNHAVLQMENFDEVADNEVSSLLKAYGYAKLISIGPDSYYSNIPSAQSPEFLVKVLEAASGAVLAWNKVPNPAGRGDMESMVKVKLPGGSFLGVEGPMASSLRKLFNKAR